MVVSVINWNNIEMSKTLLKGKGEGIKAKTIPKYKTYGLNEIQALASLTAIEENTNVVRYYHSWVEDEKLYLVVSFF